MTGIWASLFGFPGPARSRCRPAPSFRTRRSATPQLGESPENRAVQGVRRDPATASTSCLGRSGCPETVDTGDMDRRSAISGPIPCRFVPGSNGFYPDTFGNRPRRSREGSRPEGFCQPGGRMAD